MILLFPGNLCKLLQNGKAEKAKGGGVQNRETERERFWAVVRLGIEPGSFFLLLHSGNLLVYPASIFCMLTFSFSDSDSI